MSRYKKTYNYIVEIKKGSTKYIDYISSLMIIINLICLAKLYLFQGAKTNLSWYQQHLPIILIFIILVSATLAYYKFKKGDYLFFSKTLAIAGVSWLIIPNLYLLIIPYIVASFLERPLKVKPEYGFDYKGIVFNSYPEQQYDWSEITNVVIRFGMLTIDFKNNKIIHAEIAGELDLNTENEFNDYCKKQLSNNSN